MVSLGYYWMRMRYDYEYCKDWMAHVADPDLKDRIFHGISDHRPNFGKELALEAEMERQEGVRARRQQKWENILAKGFATSQRLAPAPSIDFVPANNPSADPRGHSLTGGGDVAGAPSI